MSGVVLKVVSMMEYRSVQYGGQRLEVNSHLAIPEDKEILVGRLPICDLRIVWDMEHRHAHKRECQLFMRDDWLFVRDIVANHYDGELIQGEQRLGDGLLKIAGVEFQCLYGQTALGLLRTVGIAALSARPSEAHYMARLPRGTTLTALMRVADAMAVSPAVLDFIGPLELKLQGVEGPTPVGLLQQNGIDAASAPEKWDKERVIGLEGNKSLATIVHVADVLTLFYDEVSIVSFGELRMPAVAF